jgi:hypothetical protein
MRCRVFTLTTVIRDGVSMCKLVGARPSSLAEFRKFMLDPFESTIGCYFYWVVEDIRKGRDDS